MVSATHISSVKPMERYVGNAAKWTTSEQFVEVMIKQELQCMK